MIRQEALNFSLAELLCELGLPAKAEIRKVKAPDLLITYPILGAILGEAEIGITWDDEKARRKLVKRVEDRFNDVRFNYVDFIMLIVYPRNFVEKASRVGAGEVMGLLRDEPIGVGLAYRLLPKGLQTYMHRASQKPKLTWYPSPAYSTQIPSVLESLSSDLFGEYVKPDEIVQRIVDIIEAAADHARNMTAKSWADLWHEIARDLEIDPEVLKSTGDVANLATKTLFTLGAVTLIIYEQARIRRPDKLKALPKTLNCQAFAEAVESLGEINYLELVDLLHDILKKIPSEETLVNLLSELYGTISKHVNILVRSGWDTLAMIYQRLLSETYRKAYATYYTKLPAARLLAELSIESHEDKVIDPAAGTGSLLLSAFYTRQWLYLSPRSFQKTGKGEYVRPVLDQISEDLLAKTYGLDALRAAIALSAGSLTVASLAIPRRALKLYSVLVGRERAGSLDLLTSMKASMPEDCIEAYGTFDLVIMNPPFTRSDRIPGLIGDRARASSQNTRLAFGRAILENVFSSGLAKPFLALADGLLGNSGRIAAVLPNSILSRSTWKDVRKGILSDYSVRYIVISWAPGTPNFSSDTQFREILLVADKGTSGKVVKVINLLFPVDDLHLRDIIRTANFAKKSHGVVFTSTSEKEEEIVAQVAEIRRTVLKKYPDNMYRLVAFSNRELLEWHINLLDRCCTRLDSAFELGSVVDHTKGLRISSAASAMNKGIGYPTVWGSGCNGVSTPVVKKAKLRIIAEDEEEAQVKFWKRPSRYFANLFILRRGQLDTQCVLAFGTEERVVSNVWWPLRVKAKTNPLIGKALLAFLNSTFGFIHLLGERLETRGSWVEFKKDHLHTTPIPDFNKLPVKKLKGLEPVLDSEMLRFDHFFERMAELEKLRGTWIEAAKYASEKGEPRVAPRAQLDILVADLLKKLDPNHEPPSQLYQLIYAEIRRLRAIMEKRTESGSTSKVLKDKGITSLNMQGHTRLSEWIQEKRA